MKKFIRYAFRPVQNRHYTGRKIALWQLAIRYSFLAVICIVGMIVSDAKFYGMLLGVLIIVMLVDYFLLDALSDKITWNLLYRRFYGNDVEPPIGAHQAMKQLEQSGDIEAYKKQMKI